MIFIICKDWNLKILFYVYIRRYVNNLFISNKVCIFVLLIGTGVRTQRRCSCIVWKFKLKRPTTDMHRLICRCTDLHNKVNVSEVGSIVTTYIVMKLSPIVGKRIKAILNASWLKSWGNQVLNKKLFIRLKTQRITKLLSEETN